MSVMSLLPGGWVPVYGLILKIKVEESGQVMFCQHFSRRSSGLFIHVFVYSDFTYVLHRMPHSACLGWVTNWSGPISSGEMAWRNWQWMLCCEGVKWGFGCPILAFTRGSAFRRPQGKREREEGAPQAQANKADALLVVTQGPFR